MKRLAPVVAIILALLLGTIALAAPTFAVEPVPPPAQGIGIVSTTDIDCDGNVLVMVSYGSTGGSMYSMDVNATNGVTMYDQVFVSQDIPLLPGEPNLKVETRISFVQNEGTAGLLSMDERVGMEVGGAGSLGGAGLCGGGAGCQGCLAAAAGSSLVITQGVSYSRAEVVTTWTPHLEYDFIASGSGMASFKAMAVHGTTCTQAVCSLFGGLTNITATGFEVYMERDFVSGLFSIAKHFEVTAVAPPWQPMPFEWVA